MLFTTLAVSSIFAASAFVVAEPAPYKLGSISFNNAFGLAKRQSGYAPSQTYCGPGIDCPSSCGAGYTQCASSDNELHCYNPVIKQTCCPDGSGNSCEEGYFCTSDSTGGTWCCPNGMSLAACAAAYSLTDVLVSQTAAPTSAPSTSSALASVSASVTSSSTSVGVSAAFTSSTTSAKPYTTTTSAPVVSKTPASNGTATTTSPPLQVTNAAVQVALGGLPALALAACAFFAL